MLGEAQCSLSLALFWRSCVKRSAQPSRFHDGFHDNATENVSIYGFQQLPLWESVVVIILVVIPMSVQDTLSINISLYSVAYQDPSHLWRFNTAHFSNNVNDTSCCIIESVKPWALNTNHLYRPRSCVLQVHEWVVCLRGVSECGCLTYGHSNWNRVWRCCWGEPWLMVAVHGCEYGQRLRAYWKGTTWVTASHESVITSSIGNLFRHCVPQLKATGGNVSLREYFTVQLLSM